MDVVLTIIAILFVLAVLAALKLTAALVGGSAFVLIMIGIIVVVVLRSQPRA